jgi:hypothetical protein
MWQRFDQTLGFPMKIRQELGGMLAATTQAYDDNSVAQRRTDPGSLSTKTVCEGE